MFAALFIGAGMLATAAPGQWETLARATFAEMVAGDWPKVAARFDAKMKAALPAEKLAEVWSSVVKQVGAFREVRKVTVTEQGAMHVVVLTAAFEKANLDAQMAFDGEKKIGGLFVVPAAPDATASPWQPPGYGQAPVEERAVTVGPARLPGKLVLPKKGTGPRPAVVLVHGSGPQDEDESIGPSKPFRDLALGLAAHGIVTLRYEKRTRHDPGSFGKKFTVKEEVLDDAQAAIALLATTPSVDPKRLWVAGHSLGGYLAPRLAKDNPQIAGIIILAGSTRPLEDLLVEQLKYLDSPALAQGEASARAVRDPKLTADTVVDFLGAEMPGSYFLDLRHYDPAATAAALKIPILVLQGQRDYQVRQADYARWSKALTAHPNATLKQYPTLNHLFQSGTGPSKPEEYLRPGQHVAEEVVGDVAGFVEKHP